MEPSFSTLDINQANQYLDPCQVDCNENSPPLHDSNHPNSLENDGLAMKSIFPMESLVQSDSASDPPSMRVGGSDSPEDALNNDFFYDDEFTIPFDANLAEGFGSQVSGGQIGLSSHSFSDLEDNNRWCRATRMNESKSDSCLYQADLELTDSEREMSTSEHECQSSSDMSDIRHQPLFSNSDIFTKEITGTKKDNNGSLIKSCLSGSQSCDDEGGGGAHIDCYNWSQNKKQYYLSFDRSPTKTCSSSGEYAARETIARCPRSRITNWAKTLRSKKSDKAIGSCNSDETRGKTGDVLTTWQEVKQSKPEKTPTTGLTSWQRVSTNRDQVKVMCSSSTNWLRNSKATMTVDGALPEARALMISNGVENKRDNKLIGDEQKSIKLINIYQKMKHMNPLGLESDQFNEAMTSEAMLGGLIEPWPIVSISVPRPPDLTKLCDRTVHADIIAFGYSSNKVNLGDAIRVPVKKVDELELHQKIERANISSGLLYDQAVMIDRCIQTSLQMSAITTIRIETADKSLQTSIQKDNGSRDNSGHTYFEGIIVEGNISKNLRPKERMLYSAYLLSKPLPDLSFLNKNLSRSTKAIASSDILPVEDTTKAGFDCPMTGSEIFTEPELRMGRRLIRGEGGSLREKEAYKTPLRCRSVGFRHPGSSSSDSRESSPCPANICRQRPQSSDSASSMYSGCSTSSSGIDPGSYDSSNSRSSSGTSNSSMAAQPASSKDACSVDSNRRITPSKPPRMILAPKMDPSERKLHNGCRLSPRDTHSKSIPVITVCNICHSRNVYASKQDYTKAMAMSMSHPMYKKSKKINEEKLTLKDIEYLQISPIRSKAPKVSNEYQHEFYESDESHFISKVNIPSRLVQKRNALAKSSQFQNNNQAPAKSILVRNRQKNQAKHRSWSDPLDTEHTSNKMSRPISLPEDVLISHGNHIASLNADCASNCSDTKQSWHSMDYCITGEDTDRECQTIEAEQETHLLDDSDGKDYEQFRAKKSVSFSEKIFYHSSSAVTSPLESPDLPQILPITSAGSQATDQVSSLTASDNNNGFLDMKRILLSIDDQEMPPADFMVSPSISPPSSLSGSSELCLDMAHKKELVLDVMRAVETLLKYFSQTRDHSLKVKLGSTVESPDVGRLVLEHLCPAIHAIILDGLKPHVHSLFGKVKNSAWKFVEDSVENGQSVDTIQQLLKSIKSFKFLNTPWLIFNAFVFGLLNYKAVDFWLTYVHTQKALLAKHYMSNAFLLMSNTSTHRLFLDLITSLQPLAQMPLRLEYNFEHKLLEHRQQAQLAEYMLNQHVSRSLETFIEGQQVLAQWQNLSILNTLGDVTPLASDKGLDEKRRSNGLFENARPAIRERPAEKPEQLATKGITLARNMLGLTGLTGRRPRPISLPSHLTMSERMPSAELHNIGIDEGKPACRNNTTNVDSTYKQSAIIESAASDSSTGSASSLWEQFTRQIKDVASIKEKVYKKSSGENSLEKISSKESSKDLNMKHVSKSSEEFSAAMNEDSVLQTLRNSTAEHEDSVLQTLRNSTAERLSEQSSKEVHTGRNDKDATNTVQLRNRAGRNGNKLVGMNRWSDFGTHLVNWVDKLLLSDSTPVNRISCESVITQRSCDFGDGFIPEMSKCKSENQIHHSVSKERSQYSSVPKRESLVNLTANSSMSDLSDSQIPVRYDERSDSMDSRFVYALCHYLATDAQQLSFEKGTIFAVLHQHDNDWLQCRHGNEEGLVHIECVRDVEKDDKNK